VVCTQVVFPAALGPSATMVPASTPDTEEVSSAALSEAWM